MRKAVNVYSMFKPEFDYYLMFKTLTNSVFQLKKQRNSGLLRAVFLGGD
jgi:hypothetical protein